MIHTATLLHHRVNLRLKTHSWSYDLFTLLDTDSDDNPGTDISPKMGTVAIGHLSLDRDPNTMSVQYEQVLHGAM